MARGASIVWFRQDLRVDDQPALQAAIERGGPVAPVYIWAPDEDGRWAPGSASRWWLNRSLVNLQHVLAHRGLPLVLRRGPSCDILASLAEEVGADAVFWNRRYEPAAILRDREVEAALRARGVAVESFNGSLWHEPWELATKGARPYRMFTPFCRACLARKPPPRPVSTPAAIRPPIRRVAVLRLEDLGLSSGAVPVNGYADCWAPGCSGAAERLQRFLAQGMSRYEDERDRPDLDGASRLSPHLHFGELGPRQLWHTVHDWLTEHEPGLSRHVEAFRRELVWREFAYHVLYHFPETTNKPLRAEFGTFPWRDDPKSLADWQAGRTGYPLVDAGMRQLAASGWMHNRVRMAAASFLVKHLLIDWHAGAAWFWDRLVDADLANNTFGWQWVAGCGTDAAPFFRIFNPVSQGERCDPEGAYVHRWVPELARLPAPWCHQPWNAPADVLAEAEVGLGSTYPRPTVDHSTARGRALQAFAEIRRRRVNIQ